MNYDLKSMTPKDVEKLIAFLIKLLGEKEEDKSTISKVINQEINSLECPRCNCKDNIIKNGFSKSNKVQRYKCKNCGKKFCDTTHTIFSHSKITFKQWKAYFECMSDKLSIRKTAAKIGLNKNTVFAMRHKVLKVLEVFRESVKFEGITEADEVTIPINFKGLRRDKMPRSSKKRKSASKIKNHKSRILSAIDEYDNEYLEVVDYGEITSEAIEKSLGPRIEKVTCLVTDCRSSYESVAKNHNLKLEQVKSGTYKNENGYTLSEINGLHSNFFAFMHSFGGVSTKHLQGYIDWFMYQKFINYTVDVINHPTEMFYYILNKRKSITIKNVYNAEFPFDITAAYQDYAETH